MLCDCKAATACKVECSSAQALAHSCIEVDCSMNEQWQQERDAGRVCTCAAGRVRYRWLQLARFCTGCVKKLRWTDGQSKLTPKMLQVDSVPAAAHAWKNTECKTASCWSPATPRHAGGLSLMRSQPAGMLWPAAAHSLLACCCLRATRRARDLRSRACTSAHRKRRRKGGCQCLVGRGQRQRQPCRTQQTSCSAEPRQVAPLERRQPPTIIVRRTLLPQALQPGLQAGVRRQQVFHCGRLQVVRVSSA